MPSQQQASFAWLALLGMLSAVAPLSIDMYLPAFSTAEKLLQATPGSMELTLSCFFIGLTAGQLFYGPVSDRFGRKPVLYAGFALYSAASLGCALSGSAAGLCVWRVLQGVGGCVGVMIPAAMVRDRMQTQQAARAFSMLMLVMGLAPILAPLLGGWILEAFGWRAIFQTLAVFGALGMLAAIFLLRETLPLEHVAPLRPRAVLSTYTRLLGDRTFLGYSLSGGLAMAGMFSYIAGSPFVLMELHGVPPSRYGWYFGANAIGLIASSQLNARALKTTPAALILRRALWLPPAVGAALLACALFGVLSLNVLAAGFFLYVAAIGWIAPNAAALALADHGKSAGSAAALNSAIQFFFATLAGLLVSLLHDGSALPLLLVMSLCAGGAWLACFLLIAPRKAAAAELNRADQ